MTNEEFRQVVLRTMQYALDEIASDETKFDKWFAIFSMGLVEEIQEFLEVFNNFYNYNQDLELNEAGDILWYLFANAILLDLDTDLFILCEQDERSLEKHGNSYAIKRLGVVKKCIRDGRELPQDELTKPLIEIFSILSSYVNIQDAMEANKQKGLKRYPNGYSKEASVNRVC